MSKKLGKLVKDARAAKGLTQAALAEQVDGLNASDVGKIERGEKEPSQEVLKSMAKVLGVTQKSLLEAASGTGSSAAKAAASGKTASSGKTTGKTAGKTSSTGKTGSSTGKTSSAAKAAVSVTSLTATEKKLIQYYRKADSSTKKAAMQILSGDGNMIEILGSLLLGKGDVSSMASGMLGSLLSGKTGSEEISKEIPEQ